MPCFSIQQCSCNLNNADHKLLKKALESQGYQVVAGPDGQIRSFHKGQVSGSYSNNQLSMQGPRGAKIDTDAIKRAYSEQVISKKKKEMQAKGWQVYKQGNEYVFKKQESRA